MERIRLNLQEYGRMTVNPSVPQMLKGQDGEDGFSPTATVTKEGKVATITITDKNGTTTAEVHDGEDGGGGGTSDYTDLENKPQINDVTLSGNLSASDLGLATPSDIPDVSGLYEKPSGGIPKTDLASEVQTSLGKADSALQSFTETDPTVPQWAKAESKPTYTASEVGALPDDTVIPTKTSDLQNDSGFLTSAPVTSVNSKTGAVTLSASDVGAGTYSKPSGGIPKTDLADAVQTSLGKADTAYQKPSGGIPSTDLASGVIPDVSGKADKVSNPTSGNFASLDSNGNLADSGHKHSDYLTSHQDISGKADKVSSATNGNFAGLDSNGNLTDSGSKASDFLTSAPVTDVQVNGTSVLSNGVANVPIASNTNIGAVQVDGSFGLAMRGSPNQHVIRILPAASSEVKAGTHLYQPIAPSKQHEATFYGLTKAAGVDMASSSNSVGNYTDAAKVAIQKMLGVYEAPWELIREDEFTNESRADHIISVDGNGQSFELTSIRILLCIPTQNNEAEMYGGLIVPIDSQNNQTQIVVDTITVSANSTDKVAYGALEQENGMYIKLGVAFANTGALSNMRMKSVIKDSSQAYPIYCGAEKVFTSIKLANVKGTMTYRLFGRKKWQ